MTIDRNYVQENRASTERLRRLVNGLTDDQLLRPMNEAWTIAICLAHLAFWDRRVMHIVEVSRKDGRLYTPAIDTLVNDLSLPLWAAIPPREAARLAVETANACDRQLEAFPEPLLELMYKERPRIVLRALHRNEHLDQVDAVLRAPH